MKSDATPENIMPPHIISGVGGIASGEAFGTPTVQLRYDYWQYFLALEQDLIETTYFVEPAAANFKTFSVAFARILLAAGSEIDVVCKMLCRQIEVSGRPKNITDYRSAIISHYPKLPTMRVLVPRFALAFQPWTSWASKQTPVWWECYQKVKHEQQNHYQDANLENTFEAVSGLFCLILYYYQRAFYDGHLQPWAGLFALENEPQHLVTESRNTLPDF
jgi:hypothetical protein